MWSRSTAKTRMRGAAPSGRGYGVLRLHKRSAI